MFFRIIFIVGFLSACVFVSADKWPSQEQIEFVEKRRATFPISTLVKDVDWYEPLESVKGAPQPNSLMVKKAGEYSSAVDYLEKLDSYAFIVWQNGAIRFEKYWPGFSLESRFDTASMHKTVVAVALGIAHDQGLIDSVDDTLAKYLPEFKDKKMGSIPLVSMLEMASGIETPPPTNDMASPYWQTYFGNDLKQSISHWPVPKQPFETFYYAGANTQFLGWVIERVSNSRYADYLSENLWQPIGAADARVWLDRENGMPRVSCCLQASARDWLRFGLLILNDGRVDDRQVVSADWIQKMIAPSRKNPNYGWQIWRASPYNPQRSYGPGIPITVPAKEPFAKDDTVYLDGSGGQRVYIVPSENMVIVRIGAASREWDDSILPNMIVEK